MNLSIKRIYGPPGTGKTTRLIQETKKLIESGQNPEKIAILSHTRAAAKEFRDRLGVDDCHVGTIHSLVYHHMGIAADQVVSKDSLKEFADKIGYPIRGVNADTDSWVTVGDEYLAIQQYAKSVRKNPDEVYQTTSRKPGTFNGFQQFYMAYERWKNAIGMVDFSDILEKFIQSDTVIDRFDTLIVDEGQDLSFLQWDVVKKLAPGLRTLIMAGDDDQAIYTWGGANPTGMAEFMAGEGEDIILGQSWRVPRKVHKLAMRLTSMMQSRVDKSYLPRDEGGQVNRYGSVANLKFDQDEDTLILIRNHAFKSTITAELIDAGMAYTELGGRFSPCDSRHARAILAWNKAVAGEELNRSEKTALVTVGNKPLRDAVNNDDFRFMSGKNKWKFLAMPDSMAGYFKSVEKRMHKKKNIRVSTIHSAKGMEADRVIVLNGLTQRCVEGMSQRMDDELRVFYVAVTRAKRRLDIVSHHGFNFEPIN